MTVNRINVEKSLDAEILTMMLTDKSIATSVDSKLKENIKNKAGLFISSAVFIASAVLAPTVNAMDNTLKGAIVASSLAGIISNNNHPNNIPQGCDVKGVNGWKVGGASVAGAVLGNQVGGGSGKKIATLLGGILGGTAVAAIENNRIQEECVRQSVNVPSRNMNNQMPQESIYYQGVQVSNGQPFYITARNSVGLAGLFGKVQSDFNINQVNPIIKNAMDESASGLENSFRNLDLLAQSFNQRAYGTVESRYNVNNSDEARFQASQNQIRLEYLKQDFNQAYLKYAEERGKFIHMADNAAMDKVNITQYQGYVNYIEPPVSAKIMFNGNLPNKYAILPNARMR